MKTTLKKLLKGEVHGALVMTLCLVLGGLVVAALQMAWDLQQLSDKLLLSDPPLIIYQS